MITRDEVRRMILSEVAQAREELNRGQKTSLTRERIREIVLEEAAALASAGRNPTSRRPSLVEAILGAEDEAKGMIYGGDGTSCAECGAMYEMPMAKCSHCGASMSEYVARGMSNMGKLGGVTEAKRKKRSMTHPAPKDDPNDLGGMTRDTAKSAVAKISRAPGPTFSNIVDTAKDWGADSPEGYAASLMRSAGMEPTRGPKLKGKKRS